MCRFGRDEGADLRQQGDECCLTKECGLTAHVRPGDNHDLGVVRAKPYIIRYVALAEGELSLDHGVATSLDVYDSPFVHHGTNVAIGLGR